MSRQKQFSFPKFGYFHVSNCRVLYCKKRHIIAKEQFPVTINKNSIANFNSIRIFQEFHCFHLNVIQIKWDLKKSPETSEPSEPSESSKSLKSLKSPKSPELSKPSELHGTKMKKLQKMHRIKKQNNNKIQWKTTTKIRKRTNKSWNPGTRQSKSPVQNIMQVSWFLQDEIFISTCVSVAAFFELVIHSFVKCIMLWRGCNDAE